MNGKSVSVQPKPPKGGVSWWRPLAGNARRAWDILRTDPGPGLGKPTSRHHQLKGSLATGTQGGRELQQWQIEVTGGGRIWYLFDPDRHTVWLRYVGVGHPKPTD